MSNVEEFVPEQATKRKTQSICQCEAILSISFFVVLVIIIIVLGTFVSFKKDSIETCEEQYCVEAAASILNHVNLSVDPCEDFYQFSCGSWLNKAKILPGERYIDSSFSVSQRELDQDLMNLFTQSATNNQTQHLHNEVQTFYQSCLDTVTINNRGLQPLLDELERKKILPIYKQGGLNSKQQSYEQARQEFDKNTMKLIDKSHHNAFFSFQIIRDFTNIDKNVIALNLVSGCQIPKEFLAVKTNKTEISTIFKHILYINKQIIQENEKQLKGTQLERELDEEGIQQFCSELTEIVPERDFENLLKHYNTFKLDEINKQCGGVINIHAQVTKAFSLAGVTLTGEEMFVLSDKDYISKFCNLIKQYLENGEKRKILYDFLFTKMFSSYSSYLPEHYGAQLNKITGEKGFSERTTHCVKITSSQLDKYVGSIYLTKFLPNFSSTNNEIKIMMKEISKTAETLLKSIDWLQQESKEAAIKKIVNMKFVIGFDDILLNYSFIQNYHNFSFDKTKYFENVLSALEIKSVEALTSLSLVSPFLLALNAMYHPLKNEIYAPIGIFTGIVYNSEFPISMNYGGIGTILAHELGHAFDSTGRNFDYNGVYRQWWDNETIKSYKERAQCFVEQFNKYKITNYNIDGKQTLGDNISDQIGLKLAYLVYKNLEKNGGGEKNHRKLPGLNLTSDQIFFTSFATTWCIKSPVEVLVGKLFYDTHSPNMFRVIGSVSNSPEFSKAFNCSKGSNMNPIKKCAIF